MSEQQKELICRAILNDNGAVSYEFSETRGLTLSQTIEDDKRYGIMKPANGKCFTYCILNEDQEFTEKQVIRAVRYAQNRWRLYAKLPKFKLVPKDFTLLLREL